MIGIGVFSRNPIDQREKYCEVLHNGKWIDPIDLIDQYEGEQV